MRDGMVDGVFWKKGWTTLGPGGGGAQFFPGVSPHDDKHMLVFCDMQGSYMSSDGGKNWRTMSFRAGGKSSAFDPVDPAVCYAGSTGLYKSTDYGCTWEVILPKQDSIIGEYWMEDEAIHTFITTTPWVSGNIQYIDINPHDGKMIALCQGYATNPHGDRVAGAMHVFFTPDGGDTWRRSEPLPKGVMFRRLAFDLSGDKPAIIVFTSEALYRVDPEDMSFVEITLPGNADNVFSADSGVDKGTGKLVLYFYTVVQTVPGGQKLLWRSMDGGATWKQLDYGVPASGGGVPDGKQIACCPSDASTVYISIYRHGKFDSALQNYEGIKKSTDFGETWAWSIAVDEDFPDTYTKGWLETSYGYWWPEPPICMTVAPNNPDVCVYTTYGSSHRTEDGGKTWVPMYSEPFPDGSAKGRGLEVTTCYSVHFDPFVKENMMISYTDIGLFRSVNGGDTWFHAINGVPGNWTNTCYDICYDPEVPGRLWGGWGTPHDIPRAKLWYKDSFRRSFDHHQGGVTKSDDHGVTWAQSNQGMPVQAVTTCIILDPTSPAGNRTLYTTSWGTGVFKSTDDGVTWTLCNNGLPDEPFSWKIVRKPSGKLLMLTVKGEKDGVMHPGAIYESDDGAATWVEIKMPEGTDWPNDVALDPRDENTWYIACWPYDINGRAAHGGVYKTTDNGVTWTRCGLPMHINYVYGITVDQKRPDRLYAVDFQQNCYRSDDAGANWWRVGGYNNKWGHKAFPDPYNDDMLYISTFGTSVWYGPADGNGDAYDDVKIIESIDYNN